MNRLLVCVLALPLAACQAPPEPDPPSPSPELAPEPVDLAGIPADDD